MSQARRTTDEAKAQRSGRNRPRRESGMGGERLTSASPDSPGDKTWEEYEKAVVDVSAWMGVMICDLILRGNISMGLLHSFRMDAVRLGLAQARVKAERGVK